MRILHVWDQAGVSCVIARKQAEDHETRVIKRDGFDPFGIMEYYGHKQKKCVVGSRFVTYAVGIARDFDVIHVHSMFRMVPALRKKYPDKKIVLHYHGSDAMRTPMDVREGYEAFADLLLVSTPDLLRYVPFAEYLPNPVDTVLFHRREVGPPDRAVYLGKKAAFRYAKHVVDMSSQDVGLMPMFSDLAPVEYDNMPYTLSRYGMYVDVKRDGSGGFASSDVTSLTALQALSLGMRVMCSDGFVMEGLADIHRPENVVRRLHELYRQGSLHRAPPDAGDPMRVWPTKEGT